ncbi:MAG TPA: hypothetical protein VG797_05880 [Phycisphaerales bacterium]|nr:hypothetical protein [Phycisphaerales bacterium]
MNLSDRAIQFLAAFCVAVALLGSSVLSTELIAEAGKAQLTYTDEAQEGDPPEVALGIAMGAFRGLFVNWLWVRANTLKQDGKFYEAIELSSAITRLQPRFPRVWAFHAWNMAYNISVATNTAAERWEWVKAGIELLRDQGIPRNPNDVLLHKELAWIFVHKIQGWADDAHFYYKRQLAREWTYVLGTPPVRTGVTEENSRAYVEWLRQVAEAPESIDAAVDAELRDAAKDSNAEKGPDGKPVSLVRELLNRLRDEAHLLPNLDLLRLIELRNAVRLSSASARLGMGRNEESRNAVLDSLLDEPRYQAAWQRLLPVVRQRVIIEKYHMEPSRMLDYTRRYGPLDWRHPATHAVYWAVRGVEEGLQRNTVTYFDTLNTDRVVVNAIQELWRTGEIVFDPVTDDYIALTDFNFTDKYNDVLDEVRKRGGFADSDERIYTEYSAGYQNFLRDVIRVYYNRGEIALAEKYHEKLRNFARINLNDDSLMYLLQLPLADFVQEQMKQRVSTPYVAVTEIEGALMEAFTRGLLLRKPDIFRRQLEYARAVRELFIKEQNVRTLVDKDDRMADYVRQDFTTIVSNVFVRLLSGSAVSNSGGGFRLGPNQAADLFERAPLELRQSAYDLLVATTSQRYPDLPEGAIKQLFPEPPGMAEYRVAHASSQAEEERKRKEAVEYEQK